MMQCLAGKAVLVVGGSSGIGQSTARMAVRYGARVTLASRSLEKLRIAASSMCSPVSVAPLDTLDNEQVEAFFRLNGPFHHIVISAAATKGGPVRELSLEDAEKSMQSKFWGAYRVARAAQFTRDASLTIVTGFLSQRPSATSVLQGAINAALEGLVRGLALEFAPVRVNAVSPGLIETPLYAGLSEERRKSLYDGTRGRLPTRRTGDPEDVAQAILFATTNRYTTGTVITVDGGATVV